MGLFSAIAGIIGGGSQKKASQRATDALVAAYNRGIDTQNAFSQQVRQDYMPYTQAGTAAVGDYGDLLGINGDAAQATELPPSEWSMDYESLDQGRDDECLPRSTSPKR
ncbi:hypothetical protein J2Y58_004173, partial [Sphingomonas sp. BE138]|uniref:hypothetical protein n=1 Tax=Sphingomonas sp. BE138 TaxID=2817845 RepID=UPI002862F9B2